jgi:Icc-related predicted phosphoesterase
LIYNDSPIILYIKIFNIFEKNNLSMEYV